MPHLDEQVAFLAAFFGADVDDVGTVLIDYRRSAWPKAPCPKNAAGCTDEDGNVYLQALQSVEHELVHAVSYRLFGRSLPFLEEGFAEGMGNWRVTAAPDERDPRQYFDAAATDVPYDLAARFVRFIADTYGTRDLLELYQFALGATDFDAAAREVLGIGGDQLASNFSDEPVVCGFDPPQCAKMPEFLISEASVLEVPVSCAGPSSWGVVEIDDAGPAGDAVYDSYALDLRLDGPARVSANRPVAVIRCGSCIEREREIRLLEPPYVDDAVVITPGLHAIILDRPAPLIGTLEIAFELTP